MVKNDYTAYWSLNDKPLPMISMSLAEKLLDTGDFNTASLPQSFFAYKGKKPNTAILAVPYADYQLMETTGNKLQIQSTQNSTIEDLPSSSITVENLIISDVWEGTNHREILKDDDLIIVTLSDKRFLLDQFFPWEEFSITSPAGIIPSDLWEKYSFKNLTGDSLDTARAFAPESANASFFRTNDSLYQAFHNACLRSENVFYYDFSGKPQVQKISFQNTVDASKKIELKMY